MFVNTLLRRMGALSHPVEQDRCTGRSTALAHKYLSEAILNPGKHIPIVDHNASYQADINLMQDMQQIAARLNYTGLMFSRHNHGSKGRPTVTFNLYENVNVVDIKDASLVFIV